MTFNDAAIRAALLRLIEQSDDTRVEELVEAANSMEGATVADVVCACAAMLADVLSDLSDDAPAQFVTWGAIQLLVMEYLNTDDVMEGSDGPLN